MKKEVIIQYKDSRILAVLKSLSRYLDFSISETKKKKADKKEVYEYINGVPVIPGNSSVDIKALTSIFTGKNFDARKIRTEEWQR